MWKRHARPHPKKSKMASPPHGEDGHVIETRQKNGNNNTWQKGNRTNERKTQETITISVATSVQRHQS